MRVTFLTQYYPPEMGAPQARISEFARGLLARGWEVDVVTAMPNYPAGRIFSEYRGKRYLEETADGVTVRRTWIRPDGSGRVSARLLAALSFAASAALACKRTGRGRDVLVAESPPLTIASAGAWAARRSRSAYVLNISDLWPRSLVEMGVLRNARVIRVADGVEAKAYRASKLVTAQAPDIVSNIRERFPECTVELLSNGVDTSFFRPELRSEDVRASLGASSDDTVVMFAGLHGFAQGLEAVVDAAHRLRANCKLRFVLIGDGPAKAGVAQKATDLGLTNMLFLSPVPRDQVARYLASADIALVTLSRPILGAVPSKVYEAMAAGVPVVAATGGGADRFVAESGAGVLAAPGDAEQIAAGIERLASDQDLRRACGEAGRALACERFDRAIWSERLARYIEAAAGKRG